MNITYLIQLAKHHHRIAMRTKIEGVKAFNRAAAKEALAKARKQ